MVLAPPDILALASNLACSLCDPYLTSFENGVSEKKPIGHSVYMQVLIMSFQKNAAYVRNVFADQHICTDLLSVQVLINGNPQLDRSRKSQAVYACTSIATRHDY